MYIFSVGTIAKATGFHPLTVSRYIREGKLEVLPRKGLSTSKRGGNYRVTYDAVKAVFGDEIAEECRTLDDINYSKKAASTLVRGLSKALLDVNGNMEKTLCSYTKAARRLMDAHADHFPSKYRNAIVNAIVEASPDDMVRLCWLLTLAYSITPHKDLVDEYRQWKDNEAVNYEN